MRSFNLAFISFTWALALSPFPSLFSGPFGRVLKRSCYDRAPADKAGQRSVRAVGGASDLADVVAYLRPQETRVYRDLSPRSAKISLPSGVISYAVVSDRGCDG